MTAEQKAKKKRVRRTFGPHRATKLERDVLNCIPDNWLDPILTGPKAIPLPMNCPEVQRLCNEIRVRVIAAFRRNTR